MATATTDAKTKSQNDIADKLNKAFSKKGDLNKKEFNFIRDVVLSKVEKKQLEFIPNSPEVVYLSRGQKKNILMKSLLERLLPIALPERKLIEFQKCCLRAFQKLPKKGELAKNIEILTGKAIVDFYRKGEIPSCMTGKRAHLTELYALNPTKAGLFVYRINGKAIFRGLLWTTDSGMKILDRVYSSDNNYPFETIMEWAELNKIEYVAEMSGKELGQQQVTIKHNGIFPCMDYFHNGEIIKKGVAIMRTDYSNANKTHFSASTTSGDVETCGSNKLKCDVCKKQAFDDWIFYNGPTVLCSECTTGWFRCNYCEKPVKPNKQNTIDCSQSIAFIKHMNACKLKGCICSQMRESYYDECGDGLRSNSKAICDACAMERGH